MAALVVNLSGLPAQYLSFLPFTTTFYFNLVTHTNENPTCQWPDDGSFELEKLYLKKTLENFHPQTTALLVQYLWEDQIKKWIQRSITASLRDSFNKMKKRKLD